MPECHVLSQNALCITYSGGGGGGGEITGASTPAFFHEALHLSEGGMKTAYFLHNATLKPCLIRFSVMSGRGQ